MAELKATYAELCASPVNADKGWNQRRGYRFERFLADLLRVDELDPRTSFRAPGEQIDGSFVMDGRTFLIEAKWHSDPIPASTLFQLQTKVEGKLVGTIGVFISMSGFSVDAADALTRGKTICLILFDKPDIDAIVNRDSGFASVLRRKLRRAAEEGVVYFPTEAQVMSTVESKLVDIERPSKADAIVICEGNIDREILSRLARRILIHVKSHRTIEFVVAAGKNSVPRFANVMHALGYSESEILMVTDGDNDRAKTIELLVNNTSFTGWTAAIPDPDLGSWLGVDKHTLKRYSMQERIAIVLEATREVDIEALMKRDQSFATFFSTVAKL